MDARGEVLVVVDSLQDDLVFRDTTMIHIRKDTRARTEVSQLEEVVVDTLVRPEGETAAGVFGNDPKLLRQDEASSSKATIDVSSPASDRGKAIAKEVVGSDSDMDLDELRMIDEGITPLGVRMEGGF